MNLRRGAQHRASGPSPRGQQLHTEPEAQRRAQGVMQQQLHSAQSDLWLFSQTKGHA